MMTMSLSRAFLIVDRMDELRQLESVLMDPSQLASLRDEFAKLRDEAAASAENSAKNVADCNVLLEEIDRRKLDLDTRQADLDKVHLLLLQREKAVVDAFEKTAQLQKDIQKKEENLASDRAILGREADALHSKFEDWKRKFLAERGLNGVVQ
jgi:molybdopterin converting factor small subunit